ncbi:uncharacterized protein B0T23DRAFT_235739 [Neurospora hispaniola]|uniref:Uncharacterized protein n=1 Tax=Neurospora hispaniola TaxID=588809 RepID=A0AAJ0I0X2_9PEZI|nr:hypothetical protein B0T23DRAFT_235739 [Neurospora hispaniola]
MVATTSSSMESASQVNLPTAPAAAVISEQPKPNTMLPLPTTNTYTAQPPSNTLDVQDGNYDDNEQAAVGLRGGWMTIGKHFNCCGLNCGFSKTF